MAVQQNGTSGYGSLIGSIDNGTSSTRFLVYSSKTMEVLAMHQMPIQSIYPNVGWVEQDPIALVQSTKQCIEKALMKLTKLGLSAANIATVGLANQRETTILWDKVTGLPLYNAIIWMDNRTESTITSLLESKENKDLRQLSDLTGLPINPYFSAVKYRWLIDNVPEVKKAIDEKRCLFGTVDSWLIWNFTGGINGGIHMTDVTNASRTLLMNINTLKWDKTLTDFFGISLESLPTIYSSAEIYGKLCIESLKDIPISGCVGDQQAALIGQLCFAEGDTKCTYGTGCFILTNTGSKKINSTHGLLTTVAYKLGKDAKPIYALEGSVACCGSTFNWLRDNLKIISDVNDIENLASQVNSSNGVYFVPAFQGLYAPHWEPRARGLISGMTMETDHRHVVRAAIEGVCYQVADALQSIHKDCGIKLNLLKVDGGLCKCNVLLQFQADICGIDITYQESTESTAFGAAIAAGMAKGIDLCDLSSYKMRAKHVKSTISEQGWYLIRPSWNKNA